MKRTAWIVLIFISWTLLGCPQQVSFRKCSATEDEQGHQLELAITKTDGEQPAVGLEVYQDGEAKELVSLFLSNDQPSEITIQKDGEVIFQKEFLINLNEVNIPMDISLEMIQEGEVEDPALANFVQVLREIPSLDYLKYFSKLFPVRVILQNQDSGLFEYGDGRIVDVSSLVDPTRVCTVPEIERQYDLRAASCDKSWEEYQQSRPVSDYDCMLCSLISIDPCTGLPFDSQALIGCLFGPIACGIAVFIAIMAYASSAS